MTLGAVAPGIRVALCRARTRNDGIVRAPGLTATTLAHGLGRRGPFGNVTGAGGDDVIDLGVDGAFGAWGDHFAGGTAVGSGNDHITGGTGGETVLAGDSSLANPAGSTAGNDVIDGRGGDDHIFGDNRDWSQTLGTAGGNDTIRGGAGDDFLRGGPAGDALNGNAGTDDCDGEGGTDSGLNCEA
ncbi:calcium-binding protein [Streptomyces sp. NPDC051366]|uniref:calcium-binding protein n=1 Tax=Streptomyces sp. NPDC051366 TaxID=3365652 RepID=UPI0037BAFD95